MRDGCGMDVGWKLDGSGINVGWVLDGCGMGMKVGWMWAKCEMDVG